MSVKLLEMWYAQTSITQANAYLEIMKKDWVHLQSLQDKSNLNNDRCQCCQEQLESITAVNVVGNMPTIVCTCWVDSIGTSQSVLSFSYTILDKTETWSPFLSSSRYKLAIFLHYFCFFTSARSVASKKFPMKSSSLDCDIDSIGTGRTSCSFSLSDISFSVFCFFERRFFK